MAKKGLQDALGESKTFKSSLGDIEISQYSLGSLTKAAGAFSKVAAAFNISKDNDVSVDPKTLIYVLCENDMDAVMTLVRLAIDLEPEELEKLGADEGIDLISEVFEIAVLPIAKKLKALADNLKTS